MLTRNLAANRSREEQNKMSVYKRGNRWYYDFMIKRVRYKEAIPEARTRRQAEQVETQMRNAVFEGTYNKQVGVADFVEFVNKVYLPWSKANKRSWKHDEFRAKTLCEYFKGKSLRDFNQLLIEKYKRDRRETLSRRKVKYSPASVNHELALLSKIFSMACDNNLVESNPCRKVKKLEVDNERDRYLTYEEEERLMAQLTGRRLHLRPIVIVALNTGIRRGALLALTWSQVDFQRNVISITKAKSKSKKAYTVPMNKTVRDVLLSLRSEADGSDGVFTNPLTGVSLTDIKHGFVSACKDAKIKDFTFHSLRHTFATRLADQGVPQSAIRDLLGQATLKMSHRYTHGVVETMKNAVEKLNSTGDCPKIVPIVEELAS
jgi:integrase